MRRATLVGRGGAVDRRDPVSGRLGWSDPVRGRFRRGGSLALAVVGVLLLAGPLRSPGDLAAQEMDDAVFHYSMLDVDAATTSGPAVGRWHGSGWIGKDFDRLWWSTEGEGTSTELERVEAMALYGHYFRRFWDVVIGYRHDVEPASRGYLTLGVMGLAPYWFEVGIFGFVSHRGDPSARFEAETDLFVTQRLILSLGGELDWLITDDQGLGLEAGVSDLELGIRTRYEIRRKLAPYVDLLWVREQEPNAAGAAQVETGGFRIGAGLRVVY